MKILLAMFLLTLVLSSRFEEFEQLEQTQLGKTFIETIQVSIQQREPLERIFGILRDQRNRLQDEMERLDESHINFQKKCTKDQTDFESVITMVQKRVIDLQSELDIKGPARQNKANQMDLKSKDLVTIKFRKDQIFEKRNSQKEQFETKMDEMSKIVQIANQIRQIFTEGREYIDKNSFIQVTQKAQEWLNFAVEQTSGFTALTGYYSLFKVLNQLNANMEYIGQHKEMVDRIIETCDELIDHIDKTRSLLRQAEDARQSTQQKLLKSMSQDIQEIEDIIENLQVDINSLDQSIKSLNLDKQEADQKLQTKNKQRNDRQTECAQDSYVYDQKMEINRRELETISRILIVCEDNIKELRQYIRVRSDPYYENY